jgi:hypothetical protein
MQARMDWVPLSCPGDRNGAPSTNCLVNAPHHLVTPSSIASVNKFHNFSKIPPFVLKRPHLIVDVQ